MFVKRAPHCKNCAHRFANVFIQKIICLNLIDITENEILTFFLLNLSLKVTNLSLQGSIGTKGGSGGGGNRSMPPKTIKGEAKLCFAPPKT